MTYTEHEMQEYLARGRALRSRAIADAMLAMVRGVKSIFAPAPSAKAAKTC